MYITIYNQPWNEHAAVSSLAQTYQPLNTRQLISLSWCCIHLATSLNWMWYYSTLAMSLWPVMPLAFHSVTYHNMAFILSLLHGQFAIQHFLAIVIIIISVVIITQPTDRDGFQVNLASAVHIRSCSSAAAVSLLSHKNYHSQHALALPSNVNSDPVTATHRNVPLHRLLFNTMPQGVNAAYSEHWFSDTNNQQQLVSLTLISKHRYYFNQPSRQQLLQDGPSPRQRSSGW